MRVSAQQEKALCAFSKVAPVPQDSASVLDKDAYTVKKNEIVQARFDIEDMIARRQSGEAPHADAARLYLELMDRLRLRDFCGEPRYAREMCREATSNFLATGKSVDMQWLEPFAQVLEHAKSLRSEPSRDRT